MPKMLKTFFIHYTVSPLQIVMDVHDFVKGDVNINLVGEREMVVEGSLNTNEGDMAVSSSSFRRRFCIPKDSNIEAISSVMSADGILTITIPRKVSIDRNGWRKQSPVSTFI